MDRQHFRINEWIVKPELNQVESDGSVVQLEPKIIDVLVFLARNAGRVVSRDELMDHVWQDTVVLPDSLNRCISRIRSVIENSQSGTRVIETIRKRGYRLVAEVIAAPEERGSSNDANIQFQVPGYTTSSTMSGCFTYV